MADAPARIFNVTLIARNNVEVDVRYRLPGSFSHIESYVETIRIKPFF